MAINPDKQRLREIRDELKTTRDELARHIEQKKALPALIKESKESLKKLREEHAALKDTLANQEKVS